MTISTEKRTGSAQVQFVDTLKGFPWWALILVLAAIVILYGLLTDETYQDIWNFIKDGIIVTIYVTLIAYAFALTIGLLTGLARVSSNVFLYNLATLYVQIMRGLPILVNLLYVAFVFIPLVLAGINWFGSLPFVTGLLGEDNVLALLGNRQAGLEVSFTIRAIIALALSYGAFESEIFRAGIESIGRGQMEAARSLGMSYMQAMRHIILPQAVRRVLPPLGNDFIALLKESSLVSALGVQDITQLGRLYAASSFEYIATYNVVAFLYLTMTILLSIGVKTMELRLKTDD
jgi:polar amino acid transport system permease protein